MSLILKCYILCIYRTEKPNGMLNELHFIERQMCTWIKN